MKKILHVILGMIVGMASVFLAVYIFTYFIADFIANRVYNYGLQHGQHDGTLEVFKKWSPYIEVIEENDIPITSIDLNADKIWVVKDNDKYIMKFLGAVVTAPSFMPEKTILLSAPRGRVFSGIKKSWSGEL